MKAQRFEFSITDFEEVYVVLDEEKQRLHISSVTYSYSLTLDLTRDLENELMMWTKQEYLHFQEKIRKVVRKIIKELNLV